MMQCHGNQRRLLSTSVACIWIWLCLLCLMGCSRVRPGKDEVPPAADDIVGKLRVGLSEDELRSLLGRPEIEARFDYETMETRLDVVVLYYRYSKSTHNEEPNDVHKEEDIIDASLLPVIVTNGKVGGWGWEANRKVRDDLLKAKERPIGDARPD